MKVCLVHGYEKEFTGNVGDGLVKDCGYNLLNDVLKPDQISEVRKGRFEEIEDEASNSNLIVFTGPALREGNSLKKIGWPPLFNSLDIPMVGLASGIGFAF